VPAGPLKLAGAWAIVAVEHKDPTTDAKLRALMRGASDRRRRLRQRPRPP
jgi:hypothetical protein